MSKCSALDGGSGAGASFRERVSIVLHQHNLVLILSHRIKPLTHTRGTFIVIFKACSASSRLQTSLEVMASLQLGSNSYRDFRQARPH